MDYCANCPRREKALPGKGGACGPDGPMDAKFLIVGMSPGADELREGVPFFGKSGHLLWTTGKQIGLHRSDVRIVNSVRCWPCGPKGKTLSQKQLDACEPNFMDDTLSWTGEVIICLGADALARVTGLSGGIEKWRGYMLRPQDCAPVETEKLVKSVTEFYKGGGKCVVCKGVFQETPCFACGGTGKRKKGDPRIETEITLTPRKFPPNVKWIIPTYHPSYVMRMGKKPWPAMLNDLNRAVRAAKGEAIPEKYEYGQYPRALFGKAIIADIETDGIGGAINRIGMGDENEIWTSPFDHLTKHVAKQLLEQPDVVKVFHNGQFDIAELAEVGINVEPPVHDTMLGGQLIEPDMRKALRSMAPLYLDLLTWKDEAQRDPAFYNANDVGTTRGLYNAQIEILTHEGMLDYFQNVMMPGVPVLMAQTKRGMKVDLNRRAEMRATLDGYLADAYERWNAVVPGVNPRSPVQMVKLLYDDMGLPIRKDKDTGRPTADAEAIAYLMSVCDDSQYGVLETLLDIRRSEKMISSYLGGGKTEALPIDREGFVHPRYLPAGKDEPGDEIGKGAAATGRLASPIMVIPKDYKFEGRGIDEDVAFKLIAEGKHVIPPMRSMFVPRDPDWVYVEADYSQLELRIIAAMADDHDMMLALEGDIHEDVRMSISETTRVECSRTLAKNFQYCYWYGGTAKTIVNYLRGRGIPMTLKFAEKGMQGIERRFPKAAAKRKVVAHQVEQDGFLINPFGRKRYFYGGSRDVPEGINFIPQSTGASMLWYNLPRVDRAMLDLGALFITTTHDSYTVEGPRSKASDIGAALKEVLQVEFPQVAKGFSCPVDVKVGTDWGFSGQEN